MNAKKRRRDMNDHEKSGVENVEKEEKVYVADSAGGAGIVDGQEIAENQGIADSQEIAENPQDPYAEIERLRDQYLRLNADYDNFRKRTQRDKQEWARYASQSMMEKLLRVLDSFDAATAAMTGEGQDAASVAEGLQMIYKQLTDVLSQEGLTEIPALGETFDPNVHEAVMVVSPGEGQKDNEVVMVMRKGYMFKDKVLRPSMVQVANDM